MDLDVRLPDALAHFDGLAGGVQHIALVAVDDFESHRDAAFGRLLRNPRQDFARALHTFRRRGDRIFLEGRLENSAHVRCADIADDRDGFKQPSLAALLFVPVVARNVSLGVESHRRRRPDPCFLELLRRKGGIDRLRVQRRNLD